MKRKASRKYTESEKQQAVELYKQGVKLTQIAEQVGVPLGRVNHWVYYQNDLPRRRTGKSMRAHTKEKNVQVSKEVHKEQSPQAIEFDAIFALGAITEWLAKFTSQHGIPVRPFTGRVAKLLAAG